ncbi:MAG: hypothetical protein ACMXYK_04300 [Candidatus Woesearchaeota archaeon]
MIYSIGRVCMKLAGRDANKYCVVISEEKDGRVEIAGQTRRRPCNVDHLEPLDVVVDIKAGADDKTVADALTKAGFETKVVEKKEKAPKKTQEKKTPAKKVPSKKTTKKATKSA